MTRMRERGAAAVELAIILPLLLLIIAGVVDFGRAFFTQVVLTNAAREGARAAVVDADWEGRALAATNGVPKAVASAYPSAGCAPDSDITVTVTTEFDWLILGPAMSFFGVSGGLPNDLSSDATMWCGG